MTSCRHLRLANPARWYFGVVIGCCRGMILLRPKMGHGEDHSVSLLYESRFLDFSSAYGWEARKRGCKVIRSQ
jgi:hypothetical protein